VLVDDFGEAFPEALSIFTRDGQSTTTELRPPGDGVLVRIEDDVDAEAPRLGLDEPVTKGE